MGDDYENMLFAGSFITIRTVDAIFTHYMATSDIEILVEIIIDGNEAEKKKVSLGGYFNSGPRNNIPCGKEYFEMVAKDVHDIGLAAFNNASRFSHT